jgi:hypothetical protein
MGVENIGHPRFRPAHFYPRRRVPLSHVSATVSYNPLG